MRRSPGSPPRRSETPTISCRDQRTRNDPVRHRRHPDDATSPRNHYVNPHRHHPPRQEHTQRLRATPASPRRHKPTTATRTPTATTHHSRCPRRQEHTQRPRATPASPRRRHKPTQPLREPPPPLPTTSGAHATTPCDTGVTPTTPQAHATATRTPTAATHHVRSTRKAPACAPATVGRRVRAGSGRNSWRGDRLRVGRFDDLVDGVPGAAGRASAAPDGRLRSGRRVAGRTLRPDRRRGALEPPAAGHGRTGLELPCTAASLGLDDFIDCFIYYLDYGSAPKTSPRQRRLSCRRQCRGIGLRAPSCSPP
jgi:hypothetical protein